MMMFSSEVFLDSKIIKKSTKGVARFLQNNFAKVLAVLVFGGMVNVGWGQTLYWRTDGASGTWTAANWNSGSANLAGGTVWTSNRPAYFSANSTVTYVTTTLVSDITVVPGVTVTVAQAGTFSGTSVRTYDIGAGSTLTWTGQGLSTSSGFGVIKNGAGTWDMGTQGNIFNATNGGFTINNGTVIVSGSNNFGGSGVTLTLAGGTIQSSGTRAFTNPITLTGNHTHSGTGNATFSGTVGLGAATRTITNSTTSGSRQFVGVISGNSGSGLTFSGSGSAQFYIGSSSNSFSGEISINGGEVVFNDNGTLGNSANSITIDGGRLTIASMVSNGTASAITNATIASTHNIFVGNTAGTSISIQGVTGVTTYNGVIADKPSTTGAWAKQGGGLLSLGGVSTYTGATSINNGTIQLTAGNDRLPSGTVLSLGQALSANLGTLDLNGRNQTIAGLNTTTGTNASASNNTVTSIAAATLTINSSTNNSFGSSLAANPGVISGAVSIVKSGTGTQTFGGAADYTYTGTTKLTGGKIELGNANALPATQLILNGGTLSTGAAAGFSETVGTLNLDANSTIALGIGVHTLTFANSSAVTWAGTTLTIIGWTGSAGSSGTAGKIVVGASGLDASQLAKINFGGYANGAQIVSGEVVPATTVQPTP